MAIMQPSAHANPREHGNQLFKLRDFSGAEAAYSHGLAQQIPTVTIGTVQQLRDERAALLSNRAACRMELGDLPAAAEDCRASLALQPCNAKAHYRLARSLPPGDPEAATAACFAVALTQPGDRSAALLQAYTEVQRATTAAAAADRDSAEARARMMGERLQEAEAAAAAAVVEATAQEGPEVQRLLIETEQREREQAAATERVSELSEALDASEREGEKLRLQLARLKEQMISEQVWTKSEI